MDKKDEKTIELLRRVKNKFGNDNTLLLIPHNIRKNAARHFISYCSMHEDLVQIKKYLETLQHPVDVTIKSALTYSIISLYGKCFTDATSTNSPKLEANKLFKSKPRLQATHEFLINLRHNFIAHRGDTAAEREVVYLLIPNNKEKETQIKYGRIKQVSFNNEQKTQILELVNFIIIELQRKIEKKRSTVVKWLYNEFFPSLPPLKLAPLIINNYNLEDPA